VDLTALLSMLSPLGKALGKAAMARTIGRLTAQQVESASLQPGLHGDGSNLYLRVGKDGARSWVLIYRHNGRQREAGLGRAGKAGVSLKDARCKAREGRALLDQRPPIDPLTMWRPARASSVPTFAEAAADYIALHESSWKSAKHAAQWRSTLATHCKSLLKLPVDQIDMQMVRKLLTPLWTRIPETASRARGRIEAIIDFARNDDEAKPNPARWRGGLRGKFPSPKHLGERRHFAALPYQGIPSFTARLRVEDGVAARGLEFLLLTATRTGEVLGAKWTEIDLDVRTWTIPPERLKTGRKTRQPFVIPLSPRALAILADMRPVSSGDHIFPGRFDGKPLSGPAFFKLLTKRMGLAITAHGFRSTFRDFAGDKTHFAREVCEQALDTSSAASRALIAAATHSISAVP
jgi:integrase